MRKIVAGMWRNVHQSFFVVFLCIGIIAGMIVGVVFRVNYFAAPAWIGFSCVVFVLVYIWPKYVFVGLALVAGMVLAFFRVASELSSEQYIRELYGENIIVAGVVDGDPDTDEKATKIKIGSLKFGDDEISAGGSLYASLRRTEEIRRSDVVVLSGKLESGFGTYSGFMYQPKIVKVMRPEPGDLILAVRDWFAERVRRKIPEPQVNLGLSYLLGMKTGLPEDLSTNLRMVGLVHVVVASGTHLSILVEIAKKVFGRLSRFAGLMFSVVFIVFFMAMVGWTPSILRAGIMSILSLLAWYVGRRFEPWRIILVVAAVTLMYDPMFLINLGWLLSFASFVGIMIVGPWITKFFFGSKKPGFVAGMVITTLSATFLTLPITLYYYGTMSLISVVANLLILPTLPYAMGIVFLSGVVAGLPVVETAVGFVATEILDFHIFVVGIFGGMKSFMVEIEPYNAGVFLMYVGILVLALIGLLRRKMVKLRQVRNIKLE